MPHTCGDPLQHAQIEVDDVPTGQYVGIELARRARRTRPALRVHWRNPLAFSGMARSLPSTISTSSTRGHTARSPAAARPWHPSRYRTTARAVRSERCGSKLRVVEHPADTVARNRFAFDLAPAFDAAFDQIAHGKAHIGLERVDAGRVQPIAQRGYIGGCRDFEPHTGAPSKVCLLVACGRVRPARAPLDIVRANIKVRALPVVAHQERAAILQSAVEMNDRYARPSTRNNAIARLENESVRFHDASHFAPTSESRPAAGWERSEVSWPTSLHRPFRLAVAVHGTLCATWPDRMARRHHANSHAAGSNAKSSTKAQCRTVTWSTFQWPLSFMAPVTA